MIVVPVTHELIHSAAVHTARLPLGLLDEVAEERGARPERHMVDVAVQRLVHSKNELGHCKISVPGSSASFSSSRRTSERPGPRHHSQLFCKLRKRSLR